MLLTVAVEANVHHGDKNGAPRPFPPPCCLDQKTAARWKKHKEPAISSSLHQTLMLTKP
jgi:hypothetical protein